MSETESNQQPLQWEPTPGVPVYGLTPGAQPPDLDAAWRGGPVASAAPVAIPVAAPVAASASAVAPAPAPVAVSAPAALPAPAPTLSSCVLPPALGPAMTPEERAAVLRGSGRDV